MKINILIISLIITLTGFVNTAHAQRCQEFHKSKNCLVEDIKGYKLSSLSRSNSLVIGQTIKYEVVLYGSKELIIKCCTQDDYYPIRFKLKSSINGDVIYDNKYDKYINSISLSLDRTELISIEVTLVSTPENKSVYEGKKACVGLAIYTEETKVRK
jgi:hypothetical protein